jgi:hypothetical protein
VTVRSVILWTLAALAGLLLAAGVTLAASSLSSQRVGLSAEPLTAGQGLATRDAARPKATSTPARRKPARRKQRTAPSRRATPTPTAVTTAVPTAVPTDDHGGGRGRGGGGESGDGHGSGGDD